MRFFSWLRSDTRNGEIEEANRKNEHANKAQREVIALARDLRAELERFVAERAKT
jgi:hypothetical protein